MTHFPYRPIRSALPGIAFPSVVDGMSATILSLLYQFERSEWWPAEVLRGRQLRQLDALLTHSFGSVPGLRARLAEADYRPGQPLTEEIWARTPILTRQDVQRLGADLFATHDPPGHGARQKFKTTGSTGMPVEGVLTGRSDLLWQAMTLRDYLWAGWDLTASLGIIRNVQPGFPPEGVTLPGWTKVMQDAFVNGAAYLMDVSRTVSEQLQWLLRVDPDYLLVFPSVLKEMLRELSRCAERPQRLRAIKTFGEPVGDALRSQAREKWGVPIRDVYSAVEAGYLALQCPEYEQYHVAADVTLVEVLDFNGHPCAPGEVGRVVVTPLHNFAMPLIRYDIGDYAEVGHSCACGRGLPVLRRIVGRVRSMIMLPGGEIRWPTVGTAIEEMSLPIAQFQIVQRSVRALEARLVTERRLSSEEEALLAEKLRDHCGAPFDVTFAYVDAIPRGQGGKFEDFYSEVLSS